MSSDRGRAGGGGGDGLGLGVKVQSVESDPLHHHNSHLMMVHHDGDDDQYRPFPWNGPTGCGSGEDSIYSVVAVPGFGVRTLQQPFDIFAAAAAAPAHHHHHHNLSAFKSPGAGTMAATLGFPFTDAQWKELQRQAMIYKYMMASVPVPPDLLLPIARSFSAYSDPATASPLGGGFKLRFSGGTDPEPGRCRRTDGKKWRCSRDVAPDQKYCERHLHRGRPRSRKPVEHQVNASTTTKKTKTSHHHSNNLTLPIPTPPLTSDTSNPTISSTNGGFGVQPYHEHHNNGTMVFDKSIEKAPTLEPVSRGLEWMMVMKGDDQSTAAVPMGPSDHDHPQWHHHSHLMHHTKMGHLNLNSSHYTDLNSCSDEEQSYNNSCGLAPRGFIDAWSVCDTNNNNNANSCSNNTKSTISHDLRLPLSSLTLSMGHNNTVEDEMGQIQMSQDTGTHHHHHSSWVGSPGGPLAEVLRPSSSIAVTNEEASCLSSPVGTAASSSPSGVLQKTLVSCSDSSGSSSPTRLVVGSAPRGNAEGNGFALPLPMQWLNQRGNY